MNTKTCKICDGEYYAKGYCKKHYDQARKEGIISGVKICKIDGCEKTIIAKGYCIEHYNEAKGRGEFSNNIKCIVDGCINPIFCGNYCRRHYKQIQNNGRILDRTKFDSNEIIIKEDYAELLLYNQEHYEVARTIIDIEEIDKIKIHKWHLSNNGYVATHIDLKIILLHRFILNVNNDDEVIDYDNVVDHIDKNRINNKKQNLRICKQIENTRNNTLAINNKSGITGVYFSNAEDRWIPVVYVKRKRIYLGTFVNKNDAIIARLKGEKLYYGDFAPQKHLYKQYGIEGMNNNEV